MEDKKYYIYKKNCQTCVVTSYTYVSTEEDAKELVSVLNKTTTFPFMYFYL